MSTTMEAGEGQGGGGAAFVDMKAVVPDVVPCVCVCVHRSEVLCTGLHNVRHARKSKGEIGLYVIMTMCI